MIKAHPDERELKMHINKMDVFEISLAIIAVIAIVYTLPHTLGNIVNIVYFAEKDEFGQSDVHFDQDSIIMLIQLFIGFFLLFNARNFAKWIVRKGEKDDQIDRENQLN